MDKQKSHDAFYEESRQRLAEFRRSKEEKKPKAALYFKVFWVYLDDEITDKKARLVCE